MFTQLATVSVVYIALYIVTATGEVSMITAILFNHAVMVAI